MIKKIDAVTLTQDLIRCPSVTPDEAGALDLVQERLEYMGFICERLVFEEENTASVDNLYARLGTQSPNFCFAGHVDVVPVGDADAWDFAPFCGDIIDGYICGRGAADMKGGVAAFISGVSEFLEEKTGVFKGSISFLITCDEEGPAVNGTKKVLKWMEENDEVMDMCLVGEPTNPNFLGQMIKIGRRGSMSGTLNVLGVQGHVAYPHLADNPIPKMVELLSILEQMILDDGSEHFQPSNLEITTIDVGNTVDNITPASISAKFNIRFNDKHSSETLKRQLIDELDKAHIPYDLDFRVSGESFVTEEGKFSEIVHNVVASVTGKIPELSTTGGTSDARFISQYCPVLEFGAIGKTIHKVNEQVLVEEIEDLAEIYKKILDAVFE